MIVGDPKIAQRHAGSGMWGQVSLDGLLRKLAARTPDRIVLVDAEMRPGWKRAFPRELSAATLERMVSALASRIVDLGLGPRDRIAIHLPNTAESLVGILAVMRAGAIAVPLPASWRRAEMAEALNRVRPAAIITTGGFEQTPLAGIACQTAFEVFSLRYVLSFGESLPEGATGIDACLLAEAPIREYEPPVPADAPGRHVAALLFRSGDPQRPVAFGHDQLLCAATLIAVHGRLGAGAAMLTTLPASGLAGLAAGLAAMLTTGSRLCLAVPFDMGSFIRDLGRDSLTHLVLPGIVAEASRVRSALRDRFSGRLLRYWGDPVHAATAEPANDPQAVDIVNLDEMALVATENPALIGRVPLGETRLGPPDGPVVLEARLEGGPVGAGELQLAGPMCPLARIGDDGGFHPLGTADGFCPTGLTAGIPEAGGRDAACTGLSGEYFRIGGMLVGAARVDALYRTFEGVVDAAAYAEPHPVLGQRLHAALVPGPGTFSIRAFRDHLRQAGVADYRMPERITLVESLPRDADGSILRRQIAIAVHGRGAGSSLTAA